MHTTTQIDANKGLEFTMRDSIGAMEELSLHALFSMNRAVFEVISIQAENELRQLEPQLRAI